MASAPVSTAALISLAIFKYEARGDDSPRYTAWSARRVCKAVRSASEYTATVEIPISRHERMMRTAISPRLATRTRISQKELHSEHAKAAADRRRAQNDRKRQRQHAAGLGGVQDSIVPQ